MKIDRLLSIIIYLMNHDLVSARVLAERFEVTVRTIQRDMEAIELAGIPIVSIQGPNGGYGILEGYKVDSRLISPEDLYYIVTSLKGISETISDAKVDGTLEKMKSLLPDGAEESFFERQDKLSLDFSMLGGDPRQRESFKIVKKAVDSERLLRFEYTSNKMEHTLRTVEPMTIAFKWRSWYLFAWCRDKEDYRTFRLSRIRKPEILPGHFRRKEQSFEDYTRLQEDKKSIPHTSLLLRFHKSFRPFVEEYHPPENCSEGPEGSLEVTMEMPEDGWMYSYILSFGDFVTVLEPEHVKQMIKDMAGRIQEKYNN